MALLLGMSMPDLALAHPFEDPEALIRIGIDLRRKGDDVRAAGYFKRAYALAKTPRGAAQLGLVELGLEHHSEANFYLSEALASDDPWVKKQQSVLEASRAQARSHLAAIDVANFPPGSTVRVNETAPVRLPVEGGLWSTPGKARVVVACAGWKPFETQVVLASGQRLTVVTAMIPLDAVSTTLTRPVDHLSDIGVVKGRSSAPLSGNQPGRWLRPTGIVGGCAGAASLAVGGVLYAVAGKKHDAILNSSAANRFDDSDLNWRSYERGGIGLMIGGGIVIAAGTALLLVSRQSPTEPMAQTSLGIGVSTSSVTLRGRF